MKKIAAFCVVVSSLTAAHAVAAGMPVSVTPDDVVALSVASIVDSNNQLSIDAIGTDFNYEEYNDVGRSGGLPGVLDSEKGWVPGLAVTATMMRKVGSVDDFYLRGEFSWLSGQTSYWSQPVQQQSGADVKDFNIRAGKGIVVGQSTMVTPYVEGGVRGWNRNLPGAGGYHEVYSNEYAGAGALIQLAATDRLTLSADGFFGVTIDPHMQTSTIPGGAAITPTLFSLGTSMVLKVGLSADYAITKHLHANMGVDYKNFSFGESPTVGAMYEPQSNTANTTLKVGLGYAF